MVTNTIIPALSTAQALSVLSLADAKFQIKVDHTYDDALIKSYIKAALSKAQSYTGRQIVQGDTIVKLNEMFTVLVLPVSGITQVPQVKYYDTENTEQTLQPSDYTLVIENGVGTITYTGETEIEVYNRDDAVSISCTSGYSSTYVPEDIVIAIKLIMSSMYEYRSNTIQNFADTVAADFLRQYKQFN